MSPFLGAFVALGHYGLHIARMFSRGEGRLLTDLLGLSDLMDQSTASMLEEMGVSSLDGTPDIMPLVHGAGGSPGGSGGSMTPFVAAAGYGAAASSATGAPHVVLLPAGHTPQAYAPPPTAAGVGATYIAMPQRVAVAMHHGGGGEDAPIFGGGGPAAYGGFGGGAYPSMAATAPPPKS